MGSPHRSVTGLLRELLFSRAVKAAAPSTVARAVGGKLATEPKNYLTTARRGRQLATDDEPH
jgi:hypothetical protein